jgi:hypothetical protein
MGAWSHDVQRAMNLAVNPVGGQLAESLAPKLELADLLPKMEMPQLLGEETLAAISKAVDTSWITSELAQSSALQQLAESLAPKLELADLLPKMEMPQLLGTLPMASLLEEIGALAEQLTQPLRDEFDDVRAFASKQRSDLTATQVGTKIALLLLVVIAVSIAIAPASEAAVSTLARELLEGATFVGEATRDAYIQAAEALPDDRVLGWVAALAWLLRWLKGAVRRQGREG